MTAKHATPEWNRTRRTIRAQAKRRHEQGDIVVCWRCGRPIGVDAEDKLLPYDVGHLDPNGGEGIDNAAPEHRSRSGQCVGNRAHGGRIGATITNARKSTTSTFRPIPWA